MGNPIQEPMPAGFPSRDSRRPRLANGPARLHVHFWLLCVTTASILITAWLCTLGPLPAILALVVEKHVLVALLIMRLDLEQAETPVAEQ